MTRQHVLRRDDAVAEGPAARAEFESKANGTRLFLTRLWNQQISARMLLFRLVLK